MTLTTKEWTPDDYNIPASQAFLLDNIYAAIVTQLAASLKEKDSDAASKSEHYFIDEAYKMVMVTKQRLCEDALHNQKYFCGILKSQP